MTFTLTLDGQHHVLRILARRPHLVVEIDGRSHIVAVAGEKGDGAGQICVDGQDFDFFRVAQGQTQVLRAGGATFNVTLLDPRAGQTSEHTQDEITASMPGAVISVAKTVGDRVGKGEVVLTIESMKLQTALVSPRDGVIAHLGHREGATFERGEVLVRLEPGEQEGARDA